MRCDIAVVVVAVVVAGGGGIAVVPVQLGLAEVAELAEAGAIEPV